jgi:hypothetical protein
VKEIEDKLADAFSSESSKPSAAEAARQALFLKDPLAKFRNYYYIKDKAGDIRPFTKLNPIQIKVLNLIKHLRDNNKPVRLLILKARQQGISTVIEADMLDQVMERQIDALVIAHNKKLGRHIFTITKRYYDHLELDKPHMPVPNKWEMSFTGHDGKIWVETANDLLAGTGRTAQYIHASESAKWQHGADTAFSLVQGLSYEAGTTLIHECTAYGYDGLFQPLWENAWKCCRVEFDAEYNPTIKIRNEIGWNRFIPIFNGWFDHPDYTLEFENEEQVKTFAGQLDEYEEHLRSSYQVTFEQLNWRRFAIPHLCGNDLNKFKQDYPSTQLEAFQRSGHPRLNLEKLDSMPVEPGRRGFLRRDEGWDSRIKFVTDSNADLELWAPPRPGHKYTIGVDIAEGIIDPDNPNSHDQSVAIVLDIDAGGEQVATLSGQDLGPEHLPQMLKGLAEWYNMAWLVIETNSTGEHVGIEMKNIYPRRHLYHRNDFDPTLKKRSHMVGWRTHVGTRHIMIGRLANAVEEMAVVLKDEDTVNECSSLVKTSKGRVEAQKGSHDDHCFALGLAVIGMETYPEILNLPHKSSAFQHFNKRQRTRSKHSGY